MIDAILKLKFIGRLDQCVNTHSCEALMLPVPAGVRHSMLSFEVNLGPNSLTNKDY